MCGGGVRVLRSDRRRTVGVPRDCPGRSRKRQKQPGAEASQPESPARENQAGGSARTKDDHLRARQPITPVRIVDRRAQLLGGIGRVYATRAMPATQPRAVATAVARTDVGRIRRIDVDRIRRIAVIGVLLVPSGLLLGLAPASGGFFPDAISVAAVGVLVIFSARVVLSRTAITGVSRGVAVVAAALIAFTVWALMSGSWSGSPSRAVFEYDRALLYTVVFVLIGSVRRSTARARVLLLSLAAVSVGISIAAVATWLLPDLLPVARDIPRDRLSWPTSYWNATGLIGALGLVWVYSLSASSSEPRFVRVAGAMAAPWAAAMVIFTASRGATAVALLGLVVATAIIRSPATPGAIVAVGFAVAVSVAISLSVTGLNVVAPAAHAVHAGHRTMILLFVVALAAGAIRMLLLRLDARIAAARAPWTRAQVLRALGVAGVAVLIAFLVLGGPRAVRTAAHKFAAGQGLPVPSPGSG